MHHPLEISQDSGLLLGEYKNTSPPLLAAVNKIWTVNKQKVSYTVVS